MSAQAETVKQVVIVEVPGNPAVPTIDVDFDQTIFLHFTERVTFCCDHADACLPYLPAGQHFEADTLWGPAYVDDEADGVDIRWRTEQYGGFCGGSGSVAGNVQLEAKSIIGADTPAGTTPPPSHVIHIGPGPVVHTLFEIFTTIPAVKAAIVADWPATQHLFEAINANSERLPRSIRKFVALFLRSGNEAFAELSKGSDTLR